MPKDISIKELRQNLSEIANQVERGQTFRVIRRSKPSFFLMNIDVDSADEGWETVVDFTDGGKKRGMPAKNVMKIIKKIRRG